MKKQTTTAEFIVPSLTDVDATFKDLMSRRGLLLDKQRSLNAERSTIEREIGAQTGPGYTASVAALLGEGDGTDPLISKRNRITEIRKELSDVDTAISIVDRRISEQKPRANTAAVEACREEYGRRVRAVVDSLLEVKAARAAYDDLRYQFESHDIQWTSLIPMYLNFLGDARDGNIDRVVNEMKGAGYVN
ncbi:hypothetical protein J2046_006791 [Rhizobium petrolearium]|uniref:hypothetical protein n=1 Tax=Neorhizobium petrolearium TaxID=515361 RepID=UPI001AE9BA38|nr:hypothetical protein [Neorhizobium petrolearium]MBP1848495.1 hypothetical protein [Neorhizobium petrolearium]